MTILSTLVGVFLGGFAVGAWLGGRRERAAWKAALALPALILAGTAAMVLYLMWAAGQGDSFASLAAASVGALGMAAAPLAFAGGLFGVRWRRAGKARQ